MRGLRLMMVVLGAVIALAPAAGAATQTGSGGGVAATFTYHGTTQNPRGQHLRIVDHGAVVYDAAVRDPFCGTACAPGGYYGHSSVHVVDLERTGRPDVVLDLYSGGAHCCFIEQVYAPQASGQYARTGDHNFFDAGATLTDLNRDGRPEFLSADEHFAYQFTPFSDSGLPVQIWSFAAGHFTDATQRFPHQIAADGRKWLRIYKSLARDHYRDSVGVIAAWAADEDRLGRHAAVDAYLAGQARAGHLRSFAPNPGGTRFIAALHRFLRRHGYLR